jgi:hypothetical protein
MEDTARKLRTVVMRGWTLFRRQRIKKRFGVVFEGFGPLTLLGRAPVALVRINKKLNDRTELRGVVNLN